MPVFSRKQLRRDLGHNFTYDMYGVTWRYINANYSPNSSPITGQNNYLANLALSGQDLYQNTWMYIEGSNVGGDAATNMYEHMVATYNAGSGALVTYQPNTEYYNNNSVFELHTRIPPSMKDIAINDTIQRMRVRQEVAINTVDGALVYTIDGAASPNYLERILDVHLMANPNNSLDLDLRHMQDWQVVTTATGRELRLKWGVKGSQQIIFDAILIPSLGGELGTINLPDERWILAGAAMRCYDFMIQNAPGQQVSQLMQRRAEWAAEYTRLSAKFMPTYEEPIRLHDVIRGMTPRPWDSASNFW